MSKQETEWLDSLNVAERNVWLKVDNLRAIGVDGIDRNAKIVYLFNGDFWHGNPQFYDASAVNPRSKKTFGEIYERTVLAQKRLENAGWKVISIWESEWAKECGRPFHYRKL